MKKKSALFKFVAFLGVVIIICMILLIPPVSDAVGKATGVTGDKIRSIAQTVAGIALGVMLISWGIAALSVPVVGVIMIIAGLGLLAWNLYPLFKPKTTTTKL